MSNHTYICIYICHVPKFWLLLGVNKKLLTQHISAPVTRYKLLYVSNQGTARARAWDGLGLRVRVTKG